MLVACKKDYKKIAMGLLSFVPDLKDIQRLKDEMDWYDREENRKLYLWSSEETSDFIGIIGIETSGEEEEGMVLLRHISINPSYRNEGISFEMLNALEKLYPEKKIISTLETGQIVANWELNKNNV